MPVCSHGEGGLSVMTGIGGRGMSEGKGSGRSVGLSAVGNPLPFGAARSRRVAQQTRRGAAFSPTK